MQFDNRHAMDIVVRNPAVESATWSILADKSATDVLFFDTVSPAADRSCYSGDI
jgi:hypothetical protein